MSASARIRRTFRQIYRSFVVKTGRAEALGLGAGGPAASASPGCLIEPLEPRLLLDGMPSTGEVPILFIIVEGGPQPEHDMHPNHDLSYWQGLVDGAGGANVLANCTRIDFSDTLNGITGRFGPDSAFPRGGSTLFALSARADLNVLQSQVGFWTFAVNSDNGARLRIDGQVVCDDGQSHTTPRDAFGQVWLTPGVHSLELTYYQLYGTASLELSAAPGIHTQWGDDFRLITSGSGAGLHTLPAGFEVRQVFATGYLNSMETADVVLAEPFPDVVDYFTAASNGALTLKPAVEGDLDGVPDGIVGIDPDGNVVEYPYYEQDAPMKRWLSVKAADPMFDYSVYDTDHNGVLGRSELLVVTIGSDMNGNEHRWTMADPSPVPNPNDPTITWYEAAG